MLKKVWIDTEVGRNFLNDVVKYQICQSEMVDLPK
jgi:hypothetical protein